MGWGGERVEMGTKQAAFPGAGTGLGPPPGRVGLGANAGPEGSLLQRGPGPGRQTPGPPSRLARSRSRSPSLQTLLCVDWISPLFIFFRCNLGANEAGGELLGEPSPRHIRSGPVCAAMVLCMAVPSGRTQPLVPSLWARPCSDSLHHHHH